MKAPLLQSISFEETIGRPDQRADLLIVAHGFDTRSSFVVGQIGLSDFSGQIIVLKFDDHMVSRYVDGVFANVCAHANTVIIGNRNCLDSILEPVLVKIDELLHTSNSITVDIDYSGMPRLWYCGIFTCLLNRFGGRVKFRFWYAEGCYRNHRETEYPTAGTDQFEMFAGGPGLDSRKTRYHLIGAGFDALRTNAIRSVLDPSNLFACYAHNPAEEYMLKSIRNKNRTFLASCIYHFAVSICDFQSMVARLTEFVVEMTPMGDVVLVPDGPKPLILAMSILPIFVTGPGVSCFHVSGSSKHPLEVKPTGQVFGFSAQVT